MKIAITGATGLIGSVLVRHLREEGHELTLVARQRVTAGEEKAVYWRPDRGELDAGGLEGHDAVIHLAGENIASGRWTAKQKEKILNSRKEGTTLLCKTLASLKQPPKVLLSASATGFYGNRDPEEVVDEETPMGSGFLARVSEVWERAAQPARDAGIRVVHLRFGVVLSGQGGALGKMLPVFRLGVGGRLGDGRQMIWIALDEIPYVVGFLLRREDLSGPVNLVAPRPVTNAEFTHTLGGVLHRPTMFPLPAFIIRLALGEMAEELLLNGSRVLPQKLSEAGYRFRWSDLEGALRHQLGRE